MTMVDRAGNVRRLRAAIVVAVLLTASLEVAARDLKHKPWVEKDWTVWTTTDCFNILHYSPWEWIDEGSGRLTGGTLALPENRRSSNIISLEFSSALPIREAKLRTLQLDDHYIKMTPKKRQEFDQAHASELEQTDSTVKIFYADAWGGRLITGTNDTLRPSELAFQRADGTYVTPVSITLLTDPSEITLEGYKIMYVFPRKVNGADLYSPNDKTISLVFGNELHFDKDHKQFGPQSPVDFRPQEGGGFRFPIAEMMYKGKLEY